ANELDPAARLLAGERRLLVREDALEVHVDPLKVPGESETVGARIETGGQVEDRVHALLRDQTHDDFVHHRSAHDHRPRPASALRHGRQYLLARWPGESARVRVVEQGVRAFALYGPVHGYPLSRIRNTGDGRRHALEGSDVKRTASNKPRA